MIYVVTRDSKLLRIDISAVLDSPVLLDLVEDPDESLDENSDENSDEWMDLKPEGSPQEEKIVCKDVDLICSDGRHLTVLSRKSAVFDLKRPNLKVSL